MASASALLLRPLLTSSNARLAAHPLRPLSVSLRLTPCGHRLPAFIPKASARTPQEQSKNPKQSDQSAEKYEEVEEELPWIQEKAMDLVEFTGTVTQAIPGPRVGQSPLPWLLAVPLAYLGLTFVIAFVKTVKKFTSPKAKRKRLVNKNADLVKAIDELVLKGESGVTHQELVSLAQKTGFSMDEVLRKYIRYALNEKPFNPGLVVDLLRLRKASMLEDSQVADVLNEISRRIVKEKGPVVMDLSGFTEKGFKRKLAVQVLFGKVFYLSELPEFCSRDSSLIIKEIFGVTDEDAEKLRIHTLSETSDVDSLNKMAGAEDFDPPHSINPPEMDDSDPDSGDD
ncbi:hypothetical protein J5N97_022851 [Dioscorea zingiberensis]|uniref:Armadillo-like repeats domain-containing protein n=1 Tax=Dioscorea zingiberensis TaxID=325984 RepID=A0A9D5CBJ0_9LILI|nr:hypothetical protein J5N97_022851 [Dioscorea zingiberensis]